MPSFNQNKIKKLYLIDKIFKSFYFHPKNRGERLDLKSKDIRRIAIVGFFLIGDTIMYLPLLRVVRRNFPDAHISLICTKATELILKDQNIANRFIIVNCPWIAPFDKSIKNIFGFISKLREVNSLKYDLVIEPRGDWRNILYANYINAPEKASYNFYGGEYMLTCAVRPNPEIFHFTEEALYLLSQLGMDVQQADVIPELIPSQQSLKIQQDLIDNLGLRGKTIIGLHPGASQAIKQWDSGKYASLIVDLEKKYENAHFLIFEGPGESEIIAYLEGELANKFPKTIIKKSLAEYIAIIGMCNVMICNDSGAAHIAAAQSIPTVIIFGNVDPKYVTPKSSKPVRVVSEELDCKPCFSSSCPLGTNECIKKVNCMDVYQSVISLLDDKKLNV